MFFFVVRGEKQQKSKIAASGHFEKNSLLTNNPIISCNMSFFTNFSVEPLCALDITILGFCDLQIPHEGQRERPAVSVEHQFFYHDVIAT